MSTGDNENVTSNLFDETAKFMELFNFIIQTSMSVLGKKRFQIIEIANQCEWCQCLRPFIFIFVRIWSEFIVELRRNWLHFQRTRTSPHPMTNFLDTLWERHCPIYRCSISCIHSNVGRMLVPFRDNLRIELKLILMVLRSFCRFLLGKWLLSSHDSLLSGTSSHSGIPTV